MTGGAWGRGPVALAGCAAGSALGCLALALLRPGAFFPAYLAMICAWSAIPIGCLPVLMIGALVPGRWIEVLAPSLRLGAATVPVAALLFVPVLVGIGWIYPWAQGSWAQGPVMADVPAFRAAWLSPGFFVIRTIVYLGVFGALGLALRRAGPTRLAPLGLIAWALLGSWAGIDWMLSVEARYHSSIFGLLTLSQQLLGGLSFALVAALAARDAPAKTGGLGALLLSAILLWAYLHAMQYIVAWMADIPVEADWYARRNVGIWGAIAGFLGLVPFLGACLLLLLGPVRHSRAWLVAIAALTIAVRPLETAWLVLPAIAGEQGWTALSALVSFALIGSTLGAAIVIQARRGQGPGDVLTRPA